VKQVFGGIIKMETWVPPIVAFFTAFVIVLLELLTTNYSRTSFVLVKESALYTYGAVYGLIAVIVLLTLNALTNAKTITVEGLGLSSPYIRALIVGISVKALLHINIATVKVGSKSTPIGLETIVQLFEPALLRTIELSKFNGIRKYIEPYTRTRTRITTIKSIIKKNIPQSFSREEIAALEKDINKATDKTELFELVIENLGKKTLERIFPDNKP
jgi:hypothetical protein